MTETYIALGSNLGDRGANLRGARAAIDALAGATVTGASAVYETPPVGGAAKYPFLNAVLAVDAAVDADALMRGLLAIETVCGRVRTEKWGPRVIDLDLLLFGDQVVETPLVTLPHPRLHEREFVLRPLCDLAADQQHPTLNRTFAALLEDLNEHEAQRIDLEGWATSTH